MTREQAKELASDLYAYYIEQGSPTPATGKPTGWDEVWVNAAAPPAVWSRERPTVEGMWWHRAIGEIDYPEVVELTAVNNGRDFWVHYVGLAEGDYLSDMDGEWSSSPLRPPVEGK